MKTPAARGGRNTLYRKVQPTLTAVQFLVFIQKAYTNPSTALAYVSTAAAMYPTLRKDPEWKDHFRHLTKQANQHTPFANQAKVLTFEMMQEMLKAWPRMEQHHYTVLFTWLTISRYGDLKHMKWIEEAERYIPEHHLTVGLVDMRGSKGDPKGTRGDQKAVILPSIWASLIKSQCVRDKKAVVTKYFFEKALRQFDPELSLHSCRRGASQTLARYGYQKLHIQDLSLHQQDQRKLTRSQDTYQNGLYLKDPREQNQIRLQLVLLCHLDLISHSTMQFVFQDWLQKVHSLLPDIALPMMERSNPSAIQL